MTKLISSVSKRQVEFSARGSAHGSGTCQMVRSKSVPVGGISLPQWERILGTDTTVSNIAWTGERFICSLYGGYIKTSINGVDWTDSIMYTATRIIPFSNGKVFMSNTSEFYKTSVDHGQSWSTGPIVRSLDYTAYNSQGSIISVGSSGGTPYSYSTDYGVTWFNGNLPAASIFNTCVWAGNAFVLVNFGGTTYHVSQTGIDGSWITYSGLPVWQGVGGGVSIRKNTLFFAGYSSPNCCEITVNDDLTLYIKQYSMSKVGSGYGWLDLSNDFMLFTDYDSYGHRFVHKKTLTSYTTFNTVKIKGVYCSDNGNYIIGSDYSQGIYRAFLPQFRTQAVTY